MKKTKLISGVAALSLLVGVAVVGPGTISAFAKNIIYGERSEAQEKIEKLDAEGNGALLDEKQGVTVKKYQFEDGREVISGTATGELQENYEYQADGGKIEFKAVEKR